MLRTEELSIPEYERSLKRTKKIDVISIALYHIQRVRELEALLSHNSANKKCFNCSSYLPACQHRLIPNSVGCIKNFEAYP